MSEYSENTLIEQPTIRLFAELGWETCNALREFEHAGGSPLGRDNQSEIVLVSRLCPALERLNPNLPASAFEQAIEELTRDRSRLSLAQANREVYDLIKNGIRVTVPDDENGGETVQNVRLIDWTTRTNNNFLLVSQFWITGEMYTRRPDLIGFVNGLPLVFIELKAIHKQLKDAFDENLTDYKSTIPPLFWYNALIILSNGSLSRIGSITANWEHFAEWKKINSEGEAGVISLATLMRGTCEPERLLDIIENFILFMDVQGGYIKLLGKNHQYLGVNNALVALDGIQARQGRLGVFWHTQGSGKSISMIFFAQKVLRKMPGNWTFVIVTDRQELDNQIYKNFAGAGAITETEAQATSSANLRQLLREDHRYVFTLIHKFRTEPGKRHPVLSERVDIIVITDEAHRSQYDTLALNMRNALPNASFIAFTGTPLMAGEEKTREVFGDYVSVYNFRQSVEDGATVSLYYENRIPELQLTNENLNEDMEQLLEDAALDEAQERKLEREFARQYHLITRAKRLETIAEDIVKHFMGRGFLGKAMMVSIDKATAIRMYDKVRRHWQQAVSKLMDAIAAAPNYEERESLKERLRFMQDTDMAVVVSSSQNEIDEMKRKGLDILPHRRRRVKEDLETKFKDPDDPLRIVFVCAMWLTGFDAPCCSTLYLDKPMRNHTLMQTIARANRVFPEKVNGTIVDYVGVFRNLQRALAIYGAGAGGEVGEGEKPVEDKAVLVAQLQAALQEATAFCVRHGVNLETIQAVEGFAKVKRLDDAVEALIGSDADKKRYLALAARLGLLYKAVLPDAVANTLAPDCKLIEVLAKKIRDLTPSADISDVMGQVENLLDRSIKPEGYVIREPAAEEYGTDQRMDLSRIDFEALQEKFARGRKRTEAEKLKGAVNQKMQQMVRLNRTRVDYLERFQSLIDEYNTGCLNVEEFFKRLLKFAGELNDEEQRGIAEQLSEEELVVFDLLIKPEIAKLTAKERQQVKTAARDLLATLKREKLVLDWRKRQQSRAQVRVTIEKILDQELPERYTPELFQEKVETIYQHVYGHYFGAGRSVY